jgi:hypothetical protein
MSVGMKLLRCSNMAAQSLLPTTKKIALETVKHKVLRGFYQSFSWFAEDIRPCIRVRPGIRVRFEVVIVMRSSMRRLPGVQVPSTESLVQDWYMGSMRDLVLKIHV